ncbi:MAG: hypothetical protein ABF274_09450 [Nonlabens sp.]|uniref:hypothetical protein n=4 Tax=Nonlabens sp. TaxID=1888209 RepID=UPI00321BC3A2
MKKILFLLLVCTLISCEPRLENDVRALFKTRVVDASGSPIENMLVTATTFRSFDLIIGQDIPKFSEPDEDFLLGQGVTNANGEVDFLMLVDGGFFVNFNSQNFFSNKISVSRRELGDDLFLNIPETILKEAAIVEIDFINTSGTTDSYSVTFDYESLNCDLIYSNNMLSQDEECAFFERQPREFNSNLNDGNFELNVFYPSVIEVIFTDSAGTETMRTFDINNPQERYEISY